MTDATTCASPTVSIIVATRNRSAMLLRALRSIKAQSFSDFECLVVDDGSSPTELAACRSFWPELDERFSLIPPAAPDCPRSSAAATRNRGIRLAKGRFVAFCDDDDYWMTRDYLAVAVEALEQHDADFFFANMCGKRDEQVVQPHWFARAPWLARGRRLRSGPDVYEVGVDGFMRAMQHNYAHPDAMVVGRRLLDDVGLFWEKACHAEDINLVLRLGDAAQRIVYRSDPVAAFDFQPKPSSYKSADIVERLLVTHLSASHVIAVGRRSVTRRTARAIASWQMRLVAKELRQRGHRPAAVSFAWRAFLTARTLASAAFFLRCAASAYLVPRHEDRAHGR